MRLRKKTLFVSLLTALFAYTLIGALLLPAIILHVGSTRTAPHTQPELAQLMKLRQVINARERCDAAGSKSKNNSYLNSRAHSRFTRDRQIEGEPPKHRCETVFISASATYEISSPS